MGENMSFIPISLNCGAPTTEDERKSIKQWVNSSFSFHWESFPDSVYSIHTRKTIVKVPFQSISSHAFWINQNIWIIRIIRVIRFIQIFQSTNEQANFALRRLLLRSVQLIYTEKGATWRLFQKNHEFILLFLPHYNKDFPYEGAYPCEFDIYK